MCLHERCGRNLFVQYFICVMSYRGWTVRILSWSFLLGWEHKESLTKPQVPACRLFITSEAGCRGGRGSFPQLLDIQGPIRTWKEQPQGIAPIQKISVCAAILRLHKIKLCFLIAPLEFWGVSEWGQGAHHHSPYFGVRSWGAGRPCPTALSGQAGFRWAWPRDRAGTDGAVPIWHCCPSLLPDQHVVFSSQEESSLLFLSLNLGSISYPMCKWGQGVFFFRTVLYISRWGTGEASDLLVCTCLTKSRWEQTKIFLSLLPQRSGKYHLRWASHVLMHFAFKYMDVYSLGAIPLSPHAVQMNDCSWNWKGKGSSAVKFTGVSKRCLDAAPVSEVLIVCAGFSKGLLMREGAVGEQFVSLHRRCLTWKVSVLLKFL